MPLRSSIKDTSTLITAPNLTLNKVETNDQNNEGKQEVAEKYKTTFLELQHASKSATCSREVLTENENKMMNGSQYLPLSSPMNEPRTRKLPDKQVKDIVSTTLTGPIPTHNGQINSRNTTIAKQISPFSPSSYNTIDKVHALASDNTTAPSKKTSRCCSVSLPESNKSAFQEKSVKHLNNHLTIGTSPELIWNGYREDSNPEHFEKMQDEPSSEEDNTSSYNCKLLAATEEQQELNCDKDTKPKVQTKKTYNKLQNNTTTSHNINRHEAMLSKATSTYTHFGPTLRSIKRAKTSTTIPPKNNRKITIPKILFLEPKLGLRIQVLRDEEVKIRKTSNNICSNSAATTLPSNNCSVNLYDIPPPNYFYDPTKSIEKLV